MLNERKNHSTRNKTKYTSATAPVTTLLSVKTSQFLKNNITKTQSLSKAKVKFEITNPCVGERDV